MYYAEKIINGVLMCRHTPDGNWKQASITKMSSRIVNQAERIAELESALGSIYQDSCEREIMDNYGLKGAEAGYHAAASRIKPHPLLMNTNEQ